MSMKQRVEKLERRAPASADIEKAKAVYEAWDIVAHHPSVPPRTIMHYLRRTVGSRQ